MEAQHVGILGYTSAGKLQSYAAAFRQTAGSFSELRGQAALSVQPAKVELIKLTKEMTLTQFNQEYPSTIPIEQLAIINELDGPETAIPVGRTVKRVTGGKASSGTR